MAGFKVKSGKSNRRRRPAKITREQRMKNLLKGAMTVRELIEELSYCMNQDAPVLIGTGYAPVNHREKHGKPKKAQTLMPLGCVDEADYTEKVGLNSKGVLIRTWTDEDEYFDEGQFVVIN